MIINFINIKNTSKSCIPKRLNRPNDIKTHFMCE